MASDPKKTDDDNDPFEEDRPTAMFSREAHSWFSTMGDDDGPAVDSVADLGRSAVPENSNLSRTGSLAAVTPTAIPSTSQLSGANVAAIANASADGAASPAPRAPRPRTPLTTKQVLLLAFFGGASLAVILGSGILFLLTRR